MGTSVADQDGEARMRELLEVPAAHRFVSVEPMLGFVSLRDHLADLDWVICGGETGPGARRIEDEWVRDLREQCRAARVPFFFKQRNRKGDCLLDGEVVREVPWEKKG